ncbi:MAG: DnaJ domain-containing protein, partial [Candidatus Aminicenantes bacterium]
PEAKERRRFMGKEFRKDINYYKVLQVDPEADPLVIKNAYYTILNQLKCHPDKGGDEEKAKLINEAYHILSSAELREEYDRFLLELAEENQRWIKVEFQYGRFRRSFQLPDQVIPGKINASLKDGILVVTIPVQEKKKGRRIPISQL